MLPPEWVGQDVEIRNAPTHAGPLSLALRWEAGTPVLRWELRPHAGVGDVRLSAPGLDPAWSSTERSGEVRLLSSAGDRYDAAS